MAKIRQDTEDNEVAMGVLKCGADTLAHKLPDVDDLVKNGNRNKQKGIARVFTGKM